MIFFLIFFYLNLGALSGGSGSGGVGPVILELPLDKIRRPMMRTRSNDQNKVQELMDSISEIGLQVPVITYSLFCIFLFKIYLYHEFKEKPLRLKVLIFFVFRILAMNTYEAMSSHMQLWTMVMI